MKVVTDIVNIPDQAFTLHMELMSMLRSTEGEQVLLGLIYQPPVANQQEIRLLELTVQLEQLHIDEYNTIVLGDFNLDQMHHPYIDLFKNILTCFAFTQCSNYSTHIYGQILHLVFHNRKQTPVELLPLSYSNHFVLLISLFEIIVMKELLV